MTISLSKDTKIKIHHHSFLASSRCREAVTALKQHHAPGLFARAPNESFQSGKMSVPQQIWHNHLGTEIHPKKGLFHLD